MAVFFFLFFLLILLASYICARGIFCITQEAWLGAIMMMLSLTCVASFLAITKKSSVFSWLLDGICYFGYVYLGFIAYFSMVCIAGFVGAKIFSGINLPKFLSFGLAGVMIILVAGYLNAIKPRLKRVVIPCHTNMKICFISDIHIGSINTSTTLARVTKLIKKIDPDLIILGGDMFDPKGIRDYQDKFVETFLPITSKYKTIGVIGNHEIYTGVSKCLPVFAKARIHMLLDDSISINGFNFVGRIDSDLPRKLLSEIFPKNNLPTVVIDHSPKTIDEAIDNFAFLQLSGHTHGGQFFPANIITNLIYEPTGVLKKVKTAYLYISYGAGFWGPPYRIGTTPEVVLVELKKS